MTLIPFKRGSREGSRLVDRLLAGDQEAAEEVQSLVARAAAAYRRRLQWEWEDVLQACTLEVLEDLAAGAYSGTGSFEGWIWRSVGRSCIDRIRKLDRRRKTDLDSIDPEDPSPLRLSAVLGEERVTQLKSLVGECPEDCQRIWALLLQERPQEEIAEQLGITHGALRVRIHRCRKKAAALWAARNKS